MVYLGVGMSPVHRRGHGESVFACASTREEQGKPSKDARRGRCHPLDAGFWPLWMTPLPRNNSSKVQSPTLVRLPSPNRYMAVARFCFCKNNKRTIDRFSIVRSLMMMSLVRSCRNKKYMCLSVFPCMSIACSNSLMHALCAAVTTSFCPRHPAH